MRLLAIGNAAAVQSAKYSSGPADTSFAVRRLVEESISSKSETQFSPGASRNYSVAPQATDDKESLSMPRKQIFDSLTSFVDETQHAFISEDPSVHRHLAQIYRELGKQRMLIRQLKLAVEQPRKPKDERTMTASNSSMHVPRKPVDPVLGCDAIEDSDSSAVDIFFDCVSRFSTDHSSSSINRLHENFSGPPDYRFELAPSFYPEQYMAASLFSERVFVNAIKQSQDDHRTVKYFITYAETPRRWLRIIVLATFSEVHEQSATLQVLVPDNNENVCKVLPEAFRNLLKTEFSRLELVYSVTRLSMSLKEERGGQIVTKSSSIEVAEDDLETEMSNEDQILQDIEHLGCAKILESTVIVISRLTTSRYSAWVKSRMCVEQKAPFASAGRQGENGYQDFFNDLKLLNSLRGCPGVVQFIGVVLDDTGRHLRSFLHEAPMISSITKLFNIVLSKSETIPWPIREIWASQITKAMSDIHKKGFIVGAFNLSAVGVRADGTAVFTHLRTSPRHLKNQRSQMPPELRHASSSDDRAPQKMMNFRTDIFQLGYALWLLAEHKSYVPSGYFCAESACLKLPRYMCTADHKNPVELPPCRGGIPLYFNDIIRKCRLVDPKARPSAHELYKIFPYADDIKYRPPGMDKLLDTYPVYGSYFMVHCDECGALTTDAHYHCYVCSLGDYDICPACVAQGIHCPVPEHRLMKRIMRNGRLVDGF